MQAPLLYIFGEAETVSLAFQQVLEGTFQAPPDKNYFKHYNNLHRHKLNPKTRNTRSKGEQKPERILLH